VEAWTTTTGAIKMTITVAPARNELTANAGQTIFNYTFKIFSATDLNVYITPAGQEANDSTDLTTAFTVSGVGLAAGGSITLTTPANLNDLVTIVSDVPSTRTTDYQDNGDFIPKTVNDDFDRVVSIAKKVEDLTNRALLTQQSQQGAKPLSLPNPLAQSLLRWKSDLSGVENVFFSDLSPALVPNDLIVLNSTLAAVKADTGVLAGQLYILSDRANGLFNVIVGTGTANGANIVAHDTLNLSFVLDLDGWMNIKAFGVSGTGTDTTAKINAAFAAWPFLYKTAGNDIISANINVPSNMNFIGSGDDALFTYGANINGGFLIDGKSNINLRAFRIEGVRGTFTDANNNAIFSPANGTGSTNIEINDVTINSPAGSGILFLAQTGSHSTDIRIKNCHTFDTGTVGIQCQDFVDTTNISFNSVKSFGMLIADRPGITTGRFATDHRVIGNTVEGSLSALGTSVHGISIDNTDDFTCIGNTVKTTIGFGIELGGAKNGTCIGNTMTGCVRAGIEVGGTATNECEDLTISGNTCKGGSAQGILIQKATGALTKDVAVTGNTVRNNAGVGIELNDTCEDINVIGNVVRDNGLSGIQAFLSDGVIITGNRVKDNNTLNNAAHAGIRIINAVGETDYIIDQNRVTGSGILDYNINNPISSKGKAKVSAVTFPLVSFAPDISLGNAFITSDLTAISSFVGGLRDGDSFKLLAKHALTIVNGAALKTGTGGNIVLVVDTVYEFTLFSGVWYMNARTVP